jgi:hypothetical protein
VSQSQVAVAEARGQFRKTDERGRPQLAAVTRTLLKIVTGTNSGFVTVICTLKCRVACQSLL